VWTNQKSGDKAKRGEGLPPLKALGGIPQKAWAPQRPSSSRKDGVFSNAAPGSAGRVRLIARGRGGRKGARGKPGEFHKLLTTAPMEKKPDRTDTKINNPRVRSSE